MGIQRFARIFRYGLHDRKTEGYVGNEDAVHDIYMEPVRHGAVHISDIIGKPGEIS